MYRTACLLMLIISLASCSQTKNSNDWKLIWSDEFNYEGLPDSTKWGNDVGYIANNELQYYTKRDIDNSVVSGGNLMIIAREEKIDTFAYSSARLITDGKFTCTYGRIEARMKLPVGQGIWPAFWTLGQNIHQLGWPKCGEIDIMEHINKEDIMHGTIHWDQNGHVYFGGSTPCDVTKFHVYATEWDKDSINFFMDNTKYWGYSIKDSVNNTEEFHKPHYILLNLAIGGDWPHNPDSTTIFPDTVFVDYVRVFQKK